MDPDLAAYVERARAAAGALTPFEPGDDEVAAAAGDLGRLAGSELHVPVATTAVRRVAQTGVRRLVDWHLNHLIPAVAGMGRAAARVGLAAGERLERIEAAQVGTREALTAEVEALRSRVGTLEGRLGTRPPT
ncbi:MAG: hypothetical protein ACRDZ3_23045 [Acidimicrobiia bacterium]